MIHTIVLHHPARPPTCLSRTLKSLKKATSESHTVDVIVQGKRNPSGKYPASGNRYRLKYVDVGKNLGIGGGFKLGVERFLETDARWLAKIDDDIIVPHHAWDILREIINTELESHSNKLGGVMMATKRTKTRLLRGKTSPNGVRMIYPIDGEYFRGSKKMLGEWVKWSITDFADIGCTLYPRELFERGCMPDENLFVGGIGVDLILQGNEVLFKWAVCTSPKCTHMNSDCHTSEYADIRKNKEIYRRSCQRFDEKWGIIPLPLARAAGIVKQDGQVVL
ncbi:MAG: glycosyltransferase family 2 protein [Planctomycetota bacterium]